ncbi:MAG: pimeloyl-ACP methyl ester carboxylesterase [Francisellaceae bacterium]|jgi:pimeloyl-ACP methyl ester carboxylesterase
MKVKTEIFKTRNLKIAYESYGNTSSPCVLLIHGLGQQLTGWPIELVNSIVNHGFRVLRIDNRDVGKSSRISQKSNLELAYLLSKVGLKAKVPYVLDDMANDVVELIDHLNVMPVHIVGASMGGMISQIVASRYPHAVSSLTSIMSSWGSHHLSKAKKEVLNHLLNPPKKPSHIEAVEYGVKMWELIGSPKYPTDRKILTQKVEDEIARNKPDKKGQDRQFSAITVSEPRSNLLKNIQCSSLVIHGSLDPLIIPSAGVETAALIPNSKYIEIDGMGHDFPEALFPEITTHLIEHFNNVNKLKLKGVE